MIMEQYEKIKRQYPEYMVLLHVDNGAYETYSDDARTFAKICGFRVTYDEKLQNMVCSIRHYEISECLPKLIAAGKKVVICEV